MNDPAHHFFSLGGQYYTVGRYAVFAQLNPVVGNQLHHAVEMFIKGALSKSKSMKELKTIGHKLPKLWNEFKARANDPSLARFDAAIAGLNAFEELRYPDKIIASGMLSQIAITKAASSATHGSGTVSVPEYKLCVEEIDELAAAIFKIASRNPAVYLPHMTDDAMHYVYRENMAFKP